MLLEPTKFDAAPELPEPVAKPSSKGLGIDGWNVTGASVASAYMTDPHGVFVTKISPESPANVAGIIVGDIILAVNGKRVESMNDLNHYCAGTTAGTKVTLSVWRDRKTTNLIVQL